MWTLLCTPNAHTISCLELSISERKQKTDLQTVHNLLIPPSLANATYLYFMMVNSMPKKETTWSLVRYATLPPPAHGEKRRLCSLWGTANTEPQSEQGLFSRSVRPQASSSGGLAKAVWWFVIFLACYSKPLYYCSWRGAGTYGLSS